MVSFKKKIQEQTGGPARQKGTYLAAGAHLDGYFNFEGPCVIACVIKGEIKSEDLLVVEAGAVIDGDIYGANIIIHGRVTGDLYATGSVELGARSVVEGSIHSPGLKVAEGAQCLASVQITKDAHLPVKDAELPVIANSNNVTPIEQALQPKPAIAPPQAAEPIPPRRHGFLTTKI